MAEETVSPPTTPSSSSAAPLRSSVIPIVNKLQDIIAQLGSQSTIELPHVAVVGSQSSGKSSVLEALVGRDFLPRGSDICTLRPLVVQLLQTKTDEEYGEFLHLPGKRFFDFSDIRREIQIETTGEAGRNKGVSDKQIRLKIFSPNVIDITLVDLPGITKVPVRVQPSDIEARVRTMIMSYIKNPSCLIIAVTPANSDLADSDALQIAENADPDELRTIGVITKLDIMDNGTDAQNLLLGKVVRLRLGYIGVVNRSQEDILLNRSIKDALLAEEKFFRSRPVYDDLADQCGVLQLRKRLNQILVQHLKTVLPGLKSRITSALVSVAKEHASYGDITKTKFGQRALLLNIISKYSEAFSSMVFGNNEEMSTSELSGRARFHYIFQSIFVKSLEDVDFCEDLTDDDIRTAIQNAKDPKSALFVPEVPFEVLVKRQIARLLDPSLQCARLIHGELVKINYINTSHQKFIGGSKAVEIALQQVKSSRVPPSISRQKLKFTKRELDNVFIKNLYQENLFEEMLQEPDEVAVKRNCTQETLCVLQQAFRTLDELPLEAETVEKGTPTSSLYSSSSSSDSPFLGKADSCETGHTLLQGSWVLEEIPERPRLDLLDKKFDSPPESPVELYEIEWWGDLTFKLKDSGDENESVNGSP